MTPGNPYLDHYAEQLAHQRDHAGYVLDGRPAEFCIKCVLEQPEAEFQLHEPKRRFAWAVPTDAALDTIARHSPNGVVEIGAGGGYWARLLRQRGVDVVAYDPEPPEAESNWHAGYAWSHVDTGDHTAVIKHLDRTLLLVWPCGGESWTHEVLELFAGQTVAFVGERGCTGSARMHELLGTDAACECWLFDDACTCAQAAAAHYAQVERVEIPQWAGMHDRLSIHQRIS